MKRDYKTTTKEYRLDQEDDLMFLWRLGVLETVCNWDNISRFISKVPELNYIMMSEEYFRDLHYRELDDE